MATKRVGDTLTVEHLTDERGLRIVDQQTGEAIFVPGAGALLCLA